VGNIMKKAILTITLGLVFSTAGATENTLVCNFENGSKELKFSSITYKVYTNSSKVDGVYISLPLSLLGNVNKDQYVDRNNIMLNRDGSITDNGIINSFHGTISGKVNNVRYEGNNIYGPSLGKIALQVSFDINTGRMELLTGVNSELYDSKRNQFAIYSCRKSQSLIK
jgi:hypothetical protein